MSRRATARTAGRRRGRTAGPLLRSVAATLSSVGFASTVLLATASLPPVAHAQEVPSLAPGLRGALVLEPGRIAVGDPATLELVLSTPPRHALHPLRLPDELPGFEVLDVAPQPIAREDGRWIHRVRITLRARDVGQFAWPAQPVTIEAPDGSLQELVVEGRPIEVASVLPQVPGRSAPFGLRGPPADGTTASPWGAAVAGALAALAAVGLVMLLRRRQRETAPPTEPAPSTAPADARALLREAEERLEVDPAHAAALLSRGLRQLARQGFRVEAAALTTAELSGRLPRRGDPDAWRALLELLGRLDAARFLPPASRPAAPLRALVAEASALARRVLPEPGA